jgi:hypothetical protein
MDGALKLRLWRIGLAVVACFNIVLWSCLHGVDEYGRRQLFFAGIFTFVCAFRSFLPRIDLERFVLTDSWLSSVFIGRAAATVAELSFAAQIALMLTEVCARADLPIAGMVAMLVVPLLALAQGCCWYAVATLNHGGHAIEESLWTIVHAAVGLCLAAAWTKTTGNFRLFVGTGAVFSAGYVAFMACVDVPMYVRRWLAARRGGARPYLPLGRGLIDAFTRRIVTKRWEDWREETAWLTLYFSFAVWVSLAMTRLPR